MTTIPPIHAPAPTRPEAELRAVATELEGAFLSEMLGAAGLGAPRESFGGGPGEAQFASMLTDRIAEDIAARGGIGLAEAIFRSLAAQERP